ncbi:MAG TPA: D-2-hydroxyacid dehydrogenase [Bryobacteraceae bacterium]|nr:D-2-hydroxyacid dehydrogenase [Bryobacteraceae bacterium]
MTILVAADLPAGSIEKIRRAAGNHNVVVSPCAGPEELAPSIPAGTEVLLSPYLPTPDTVPALQWVQTFGAGIDHLLDHPLCGRVRITTSSGIHAAGMAELVFAFILSFQRNMRKIHEYRDARKWPVGGELFRFFDRPTLPGQTLGLVGFGSVGGEIGRLGDAFGMRVLAVRRDPALETRRFSLNSRPPVSPHALYGPEALPEVAAQADYLVVTLPLTPETRHAINADIICRMKPSSVLINVGRGAVVDEAALIEALRQRRIAGAALDVFEQEPLPPDHPFYGMDHVLLSPHVGGARADYGAQVAEVFAANLKRYCAGEPLLNEVDWARRY